MSAFILAGSTLRLLDLRGSAPLALDRALGGGGAQGALVDDEGRWIYTDQGVVYDGRRADDRPHPLGCGTVTSLAGSPEKLAVATSDRNIRIYALRAGAPTLRATIEGIVAQRIELTPDARHLIVQGTRDGDPSSFGSALRTFELDADGQPISEKLLRADRGAAIVHFSVSADGSRVSIAECAWIGRDAAPCQVSVLDDGREVFTTTSTRRAEISPAHGELALKTLLSPSGRLLAIEDGVPGVVDARATTVLADFTRATTLSDTRPELWLDEEHLLVTLPRQVRAVVDLTGKVLPTGEGLIRGVLKTAGHGRYHDSANVFNAADGTLLWNGHRDIQLIPQDRAAAVVGDYFVYATEREVGLAKVPPATGQQVPGL
jgi:hypothetical protein